MGMKILNGELLPCSSDPHKSEIAHQHIASLGGALAVDRIVKALSSLPGKNSLNNVSCRIRKYRMQSNALYVQVRDEIQKMLGKRGSSYAAQKFPSTTVSEVKKRAAKMSSVLGRFADVSISEVDNNCYEIKMLSGKQ